FIFPHKAETFWSLSGKLSDIDKSTSFFSLACGSTAPIRRFGHSRNTAPYPPSPHSSSHRNNKEQTAVLTAAPCAPAAGPRARTHRRQAARKTITYRP